MPIPAEPGVAAAALLADHLKDTARPARVPQSQDFLGDQAGPGLAVDPLALTALTPAAASTGLRWMSSSASTATAANRSISWANSSKPPIKKITVSRSQRDFRELRTVSTSSGSSGRRTACDACPGSARCSASFSSLVGGGCRRPGLPAEQWTARAVVTGSAPVGFPCLEPGPAFSQISSWFRGRATDLRRTGRVVGNSVFAARIAVTSPAPRPVRRETNAGSW